MANTSARNLREIQESIQATVMNPSLPRTPERLDIYGEAYFSRILESLSEDFPIVKALSGETAFSRLVADYLKAYPSRSFTLGQVGHSLPAFLASHESFQDMPVIAAAAKAEWTAITMLYSSNGDNPITIESTWPLEKIWILRLQPLDALEGDVTEAEMPRKFELNKVGVHVNLKAARSVPTAAHFQTLLSLITRLSMGFLFAESGYGKLQNLDGVTQYFTSLGIPYPEFQAPLVSGIELAAGLALILGFLTRLSAIPLAAIMIVALGTAKADEVHSLSDLLGLAEFSYLLLLIWLIASGGGKLAIDQPLKRRKLPKVLSYLLGGAAAFLTISLAKPSTAMAFVASPSQNPSSWSVEFRTTFDRGKLEPTEDKRSFQTARMDLYQLGLTKSLNSSPFGSDHYLRLDLKYLDTLKEEALGTTFHEADRGSAVSLTWGFDLIHKPETRLSFYASATPLLSFNAEKFAVPRVDVLALGLVAANEIHEAYFSEGRVHIGAGAFGKQNSYLLLSHLFGRKLDDLLNHPVTFKAGPYAEMDFTERFDSRYDAVFPQNGQPDRVRSMKFGILSAIDFALTEGTFGSLTYVQKVGGYDATATQAYSVAIGFQY